MPFKKVRLKMKAHLFAMIYKTNNERSTSAECYNPKNNSSIADDTYSKKET